MVSPNDLRVERVPAPIRSQVTENLRRAILTRNFAPGQRLIERELVEMTGVSRTSIREALRELAAEGLVSTTPNKGSAVATVTAEQADEIYAVRAVLEGLAGRLFVRNAGESRKRALARQLARIESLAAKNADTLEAEDEFYRILFDGAGNEALRATATSLLARVTFMRSLSLSLPGRPAQSAGELRAVLEAIVDGDADRAAAACGDHVDSSRIAAVRALDDTRQR